MPSQSIDATLWYKRKITDTLGHDITSDPVYFAFIECPALGQYPKPADEDDWYPATYFGPSEFNTWGVLVGVTGSKVPHKGVHGVWLKIGDDPESYVSPEPVDILEILPF